MLKYLSSFFYIPEEPTTTPRGELVFSSADLISGRKSLRKPTPIDYDQEPTMAEMLAVQKTKLKQVERQKRYWKNPTHPVLTQLLEKTARVD